MWLRVVEAEVMIVSGYPQWALRQGAPLFEKLDNYPKVGPGSRVATACRASGETGGVIQIRVGSLCYLSLVEPLAGRAQVTQRGQQEEGSLANLKGEGWERMKRVEM